MSDTVIKLEDISKRYRLGLVGTGSLRDDIVGWWYRMQGKPDPTMKIGQENVLDKSDEALSSYIWALKDINLEVKQGERLGIIGKNGAGKSTLLKILSRVTGPTTGKIKVKGRIASLLEVGTGFHGELTGRENIFLNGAVLGMTKSEIKRKFDEIVDFAGVEKYIDTPVKRYSSGMYVRLAFAVAAHLEPDILIVDEVLAVGDAEFQKKAIGKMKDVSEGEGRTVLFVSHNMQSISILSTCCVLLSKGNIAFQGKTEETINKYLDSNNFIRSLSYENTKKNNLKPFISKIVLNTSQPNNYHINGKNFEIEIDFCLPYDIVKTCITLSMLNERDISCLDFSFFDDYKSCSKKGNYKLIFKFPILRLYMGKYDITYYFAEPPGGEIFEIKDKVCSFEVAMYSKTRGDWDWQPYTTVYIEDYNCSIIKK